MKKSVKKNIDDSIKQVMNGYFNNSTLPKAYRELINQLSQVMSKYPIKDIRGTENITRTRRIPNVYPNQNFGLKVKIANPVIEETPLGLGARSSGFFMAYPQFGNQSYSRGGPSRGSATTKRMKKNDSDDRMFDSPEVNRHFKTIRSNENRFNGSPVLKRSKSSLRAKKFKAPPAWHGTGRW